MADEELGSLKDCYVIQANGKKALAVTGGGIALDNHLVDGNGDALEVDPVSRALVSITEPHKEKHEGEDFLILYSVPSLGAMTSPNDTITLTFKTPDTAKWGHFTFRVTGSPGWRVRLIEAPSGGGAAPTGSLNIYNSDRNSVVESTFLDVAGSPAAGKMSFDATLATGGITLWDEYIAGPGGPQSAGDVGGHDEEIILKQNTIYQLSMFGTDTDPATLKIGFYEHANKG